MAAGAAMPAVPDALELVELALDAAADVVVGAGSSSSRERQAVLMVLRAVCSADGALAEDLLAGRVAELQRRRSQRRSHPPAPIGEARSGSGPHAFAPTMIGGDPSLVCRRCHRWWDDDVHEVDA